MFEMIFLRGNKTILKKFEGAIDAIWYYIWMCDVQKSEDLVLSVSRFVYEWVREHPEERCPDNYRPDNKFEEVIYEINGDKWTSPVAENHEVK